MRKLKIIVALLGIMMTATLVSSAQQTSTKLTDYVNPFIGTGAVDGSSLSGSNFPGATVPFGMIQLSPDTRDAGGSTSGYDYNDNTIVGFSHTHISGTGVQELLDILLMPAIGGMSPESLKPNSVISGYSSHFSHGKA